MDTLTVGGVGSIACQIAKSAYGAKKVITTVSTDNVAKVNDLFGKDAVDKSMFKLRLGGIFIY